MKRILRFFVPHRLDAIALVLLLFLTALVWAIESVDFFAPWYGLEQSDNLTVIAFFSWTCLGFLAVGVAAGWGRCSRPAAIFMLVCSIAACIACYYALDNLDVDKSAFELWYGGVGITNRLSPENRSQFLHMFWAFPTALVGGYLAVISFRSLPRLFSKTASDRFNLNRQKILVIAATCLFVISMGSRALDAFQGGADRSTGEFIPILLLNIAIALAALVILVVLPSWIVLVNKSIVWKLVFSIFALVLLGFGIWQANFYIQNTRGGYEVAAQLGIAMTSGLVFVLALIGLKRIPVADEVPQESRRTKRVLPTVWTLLILAAAVGVASLSWLFETTILVADPLDSYNWHRARLAKKYLSPSGSKVTCRPFPQAVNIWTFSDSVDKDILKIFDEVNDGSFSMFVNLQPHIDTAPISDVALQFALQDCKINRQQ